MKQTPGSELQLTKIKTRPLETLIRCLASLILLLVLSAQAYAEHEISFLTPEHRKRVDHGTVWLVASTKAVTIDMAAVLKNKDTVKRIDGEAHEGDGEFLFHASLSLETGLNEVTLGEESFSIFYRSRYRSSDKARDEREAFYKYPPYFFHRPEKEERCSDCHEFDGECLQCHAQLLSAEHIHGPLGPAVQGSGVEVCVVCHDPESNSARFAPRSGGKAELCFGCHQEAKVRLLNKKYFHGPVGSGECTVCHDAHGGPLRLQLFSEGIDLCFLCHDQKRIVGGKTVHGVIQSKGCGACHATHSSDYRAILLDDENALCSKAECHPRFAGKTEDHPVRNHPVTGKFGPDRKLSCSSCHDPHSSDFPLLLPGERHSFCSRCHEGMTFSPAKTDTALLSAAPPH